MQQQRLEQLLDKYFNGSADEAELAEFFAAARNHEHEQILQELMAGKFAAFEPSESPFPLGSREKMLAAIREQAAIGEGRRQSSRWRRLAVAASVIFVLAAGGYFLLHPAKPQQIVALVKHDVAPGGTRAILTLSNGQKIVLDNQQGQIASQGKTNILLNAKGQVNYQTTADENATAEIYNTLTVPIGNHRDMTLADGTEVSLDAGSSITYPVAFTQAERKVSITGQAYFKVKHDEHHPFYVNVSGLTIQDIGTEFNINAYSDEGAVKTTLVEGSIKVNSTLLRPGQQAIAHNDRISVKDADIEAVTAWRANNFLFRNQDLTVTMRQIARWYNVTVNYDHPPENLRILADISREHNLSVVLRAIERTGKVKFKLEGRTVTVTR